MELVTAGSIVSQAAVQLGLVGATVADPFSSTDPNLVRLCSLLGSLGQELRGKRQWNSLRQTYLFSTVQGSSLYPRAPDFDRYIDQTGWNRTNRLPLGGPLSPQDRELLKALLVGVTFNVLFDLVGNNFRTYPDTTMSGNFLIAYEYLSNWWVQPVVPVWKTGTTYATGQVVSYLGALQYCSNPGNAVSTVAPNYGTPGINSGGDGVGWVYAPPWTPNTNFSVFSLSVPGVNFMLAQANGSIYGPSTAGKTSSTGTGPQERGVNIPDGAGAAGTPVWSWITATTSPATAAPTLSTDTCWFDQLLMVRGLKRAYRMDKGWSISEAQDREWLDTLAAAMSTDSAGKALSLHRQSGGNPLIGSQNVPITNFGQPV